MCPTSEFLKSRLPTVAGLLLCKQRHQGQAVQICQKWHNRLNHPEARDAIRNREYSLLSNSSSGRGRQESSGMTVGATPSSVPPRRLCQ
jgi:hypothetical protein